MKIKFRNHTYTFLIVPESGSSTIRMRIPLWTLLMLPLIIASLCAALYMLNGMNQTNAILLSEVEERLHLKESEMEDTIIDKNIVIQKLQTDIVALSQHADEVRMKVEELKLLERELRRLAGDPIDDEESKIDKKPAVNIATLSSNTVQVGGLYNPPAQQGRIDQLVNITEFNYTSLEDEMESLYSNLIEAKDEVLAYQHLQRITPSIWPTDSRKISSEYGNRRDPFTRRISFHSGIDIAARTGSPVYAAADGTVTTSAYDRSKGYYIVINHTNGLQTQYMHLSKTLVKKGQKVEKGETIGNIGSTGRSTGPHLHYEVIVNGKSVNPKPYMQTSRKG